jgi:prepilin-type N-terminal cleavage/methylation domain-containing protein
MRRKNHGFTLVEIAIVLVIIGLIVGGVLLGQDLIRASQLQAIPREAAKYTAAMGTFRDKYFALPGDMPNAVSFWGAAAGGRAEGVDATCQALTTPSTTTATCNGNGDGQVGIDFTTGDDPENYRFWQHLTNAGLIEGRFSGIADATDVIVPGTNVPVSKLPTAGWSINWRPPTSLTSTEFEVVWHNYLAFGAGVDPTSMPTPGWGGVLTGLEAYNIDVKTDDGVPSSGTIVTSNSWDYPDCVLPGTTAFDFIYDSANAQVACHLFFLTGY